MIKVSDYIVDFLQGKGVTVIFGYQGSSVSHLIDSIDKKQGIRYIQLLHEQAVSFAANGFFEASRKLGVGVSCSGPGALNLVTGIANAFYDSNCCLFITGQVSTSGIRTNKNMRQLGFQETDIVSIVKPITKYAETVVDASKISYYLEKAFDVLTNGRPGPVVLDVPHNVQNTYIEIDNLLHYETQINSHAQIEDWDEVVQMIVKSKRPVVLLGGGMKGVSYRIRRNLEKMATPIVSTYRGKDVINNNSENYFGVIGAYGNRCANQLVKYCDTLLVLGSRLDGRQTGDDLAAFSRNKQIICIDIDEEELEHKKEYVEGIRSTCELFANHLFDVSMKTSNENWMKFASKWKKKFELYDDYMIEEYVNPNRFIKDVTKEVKEGLILTADVGQNQIWVNASAVMSENSVLIQSCGLGTMGYSLPASIGAACANPDKIVISISGDGGFQMNIQELETIRRLNLPIKIIVMNNQSLGLIRVYQDKALSSNHAGSVEGFSMPGLLALANAYSIPYVKINSNDYLDKIRAVLSDDRPYVVEVNISSESTCYPEPTYRKAVHIQSPMIPDKEFKEIKGDLNNV